MPAPRKYNNRKTAIWLVALLCLMIGVSFASVPLYRLFCQVTGFGGTTQIAESAPENISKRKITIRFNTDVYKDLPWTFQPDRRSVTLSLGEVSNMVFHVKNDSDQTLVGSSTFNVIPESAGIYFNKLQCFCFTRHALKPGESAEFPVQFFVDADLEKDPNLDGVDTITLSYTFFKASDQTLVSEAKSTSIKP